MAKKVYKIVFPLLLFFLGSIFIISYTFIDHSFFKEQLYKISLANMKNKLAERQQYLQYHLKKSSDILKAISSNKFFIEYLKDPKTNKEKPILPF